MRFIIYNFILITLLTISLTACETMEGAGRDIEGAGESIQKSAQ